jgi:hypothetical protein
MKTLRFIGLVLGLLALLASARPAAAETSSTVAPSEGPPGTRFVFIAAGFTPNEQLSFWLNLPDGRVQVAGITEPQRATAQGEATWVWTAPQDAPLGVWQMVAHGRGSGVERVIAFTIVAPTPTDTLPYGVVPTSGSPGTVFHFYATGFRALEGIVMEARGPSDAIVTEGFVLLGPANADGRVDGSWTAPANAAPGDWQMVARGVNSDVTRAIPITILPGNAPAPATLSASPGLGSPGLRFSFSGAGFAPDEEISVWLNLPDGRVVAARVEGITRAGPDGRVGWTWVAPAEGPLGDWQMVAHGIKSGTEAVASFALR